MLEKVGFAWFCMNFAQLVENDDEDEKVIPKTASVGRGQKPKLSIMCYNVPLLLVEADKN